MEHRQHQKRISTQDLYYYRPLHLWAKCAGLLPNFNINNPEAYKGPCWHGIIMACFFCFTYAYEIYAKVTIMWYAFPPSIFMTDVGGDLALAMTNVTSIIRLSLIKAKQFCKLVENLKHIDLELRTISKNIEYPRKQFIVEFIMANILFVTYYIYDAYIWIDSVTWGIYKWFFLRDVQCFHVVILSLVVRNYSLALSNRVRILNQLIENLKPPNDSISMSVIDRAYSSNMTIKNRSTNALWHVQKIRSIFAKICTTIEIFNNIFGWLYLILYITIVMYLLTPLNVALVYGIGNKKIGNADFGGTLLLLCVLWCALPSVIGFNIFSAAERIHFEFKRTPIICYLVIDEFTTAHQSNVLVAELEKLAQQVFNSHPELTAAGFFEVNYAIFFALFGSLSSYLIVLMQFM